MKQIVQLAAAAVLMATAGHADDTAADLAGALLAASGAPGVIVGVDRAGLRDIAVAGVRAMHAPDQLQVGDLWHLGSIGKSMTATLVARLAEDGGVQWDDTVGQMLGPMIPDMDTGYRDVTYAGLLAHQAGVGANAGLMLTVALSGARPDLPADRLRYATAMLTTPPGPKAYAYSNAGYVIAGAMLETATGQAWEDLMQQHVFDPLGLDSAGFGPPGKPGVIDQPRGHKAGWLELAPTEPGPHADNIAALGPAGTVHMAADDVLDYLGTHLREDPAFLAPESWSHLHVPAMAQNYVAGWNVLADGTLMHSGSNTLWFAQVYVVPSQDILLFVASNSGDVDAQRAAFRQIAVRVLGALPD